MIESASSDVWVCLKMGGISVYHISLIFPEYVAILREKSWWWNQWTKIIRDTRYAQKRLPPFRFRYHLNVCACPKSVMWMHVHEMHEMHTVCDTTLVIKIWSLIHLVSALDMRIVPCIDCDLTPASCRSRHSETRRFVSCQSNILW